MTTQIEINCFWNYVQWNKDGEVERDGESVTAPSINITEQVDVADKLSTTPNINMTQQLDVADKPTTLCHEAV
jgi:hypothetical protein